MSRRLGWHRLLGVALVAASLHAYAAPNAKAVRSEPPKHTEGDVGQLPAEVQAALQRAKVPSDNLHVMVVDTHAGSTPRLSHQAQVRVNPASLMKLATTTAALDSLGPAFVWRTPVYVDGPVRDGVLQGNVYIKGSGDPRFVVERLWLLMRRLQGLGIHKIQGDIVLDRSAFDVPARDAAFAPLQRSTRRIAAQLQIVAHSIRARPCRQRGACAN
jgi:D-alanyl-D-alanine carboxypeptidase/D-alanyl-D-alanine-endopeptidase (penicillin-binding protein 4)